MSFLASEVSVPPQLAPQSVLIYLRSTVRLSIPRSDLFQVVPSSGEGPETPPREPPFPLSYVVPVLAHLIMEVAMLLFLVYYMGTPLSSCHPSRYTYIFPFFSCHAMLWRCCARRARSVLVCSLPAICRRVGVVDDLRRYLLQSSRSLEVSLLSPCLSFPLTDPSSLQLNSARPLPIPRRSNPNIHRVPSSARTKPSNLLPLSSALSRTSSSRPRTSLGCASTHRRQVSVPLPPSLLLPQVFKECLLG